jgi:hypothetical protein
MTILLARKEARTPKFTALRKLWHPIKIEDIIDRARVPEEAV